MPIYLDHNATTPMRPEAAAAMTRAFGMVGNASSVHADGRAARRLIEEAREILARAAGAASAEILFSSGGTEANNLALYSAGEDPIFVGATEHPSVLEAAAGAAILPVDGDGILDVEAARQLISSSDGAPFVSVMLANNETGVIQPVEEIAAIVRERGGRLHCDAVQGFGKIPVSFDALDVDLMTLSAHKIGGPQGMGALIARKGQKIRPMLRGGGQERSYRAGTENAAGIAGFGAAADVAVRQIETAVRLAPWRDLLENRISAICPAALVFGQAVPRVANTSCITMPGVTAETQVMAFDLEEISVSAGSACSSGKVSVSHVLTAMGAGEDVADTAVRVSLGWNSTEADVDGFAETWEKLYARLGIGAEAALEAAE